MSKGLIISSIIRMNLFKKELMLEECKDIENQFCVSDYKGRS